MKNAKQIWEETAKQLEKIYDRREAEQISYLLLEDVFGVKKADILIGDYLEIDAGKLKNRVNRLLDHEPVQYVTGVADFYGRKFHIAPGALIPRPETEELCELIISENRMSNPKIMEVGVGSGCIAITLALALKADVFGTDVSDKALSVARSNAKNMGAQVSFAKSDVLSEDLPESELDILVSNPPYIPDYERGVMRENVLKHEPELALFVPDDNPIVFYKRIADEGQKSLKKGGKLYFEVHEDFGAGVKDYLDQIGYSEVIIYKDMQGKDRMVSGVRD